MLGSHEELEQQGFDANEIMQNYTQSLQKAQSSKEEEEKQRQLSIAEKAAIDEETRTKRLLQLKQITEKHAIEKEKYRQAHANDVVEEADDKKKGQAPAELIVDEEPLPGTIGIVDYRNLVSFGPKCWGFLIFFFVVITTSLMQLATSFTLANWTSQDLEEQQSSFYYPGMFIGAVILYVFFCLCRALVTFWVIITSGTNLHNYVANRVLRA